MAATATDLASSARPRGSLEGQLGRHAVVMIVASGAAVATGWRICLALPAIISFALLLRYRQASSSRVPGGVTLADALTGARLALLTLTAAAMPMVPAAWVLIVFAANVLLDGLDGFVARRLDQATAFGAVFDREVDAFFVLVAYLYFPLDGWLAAAVLVAGLLPYLYRLVAAGRPMPVSADHKERAAAALAGVNFLMLLAAVALPTYTSSILVASMAVLYTSFASSFRGLYRHAYPLP